MKIKTLILTLLGLLTCVLFILISISIKNISLIWIHTRIFGLFSFISLFLTVVIGELRVLMIKKGRLKIFKYHKPIALFSIFLVFLHFVSAAADNYKWGKQLTFTQYLGFSFSDSWLIFLSFGALTFYLMILLGVTSQPKSMQVLGYKNWKKIHYFSYLALILGYIHSVNLGTDLKHSSLAFFLKPLFVVMFLIAIALLITRILKYLKLFSDQWEINLGAIFFIMLLIGTIVLISSSTAEKIKLDVIKNSINESKTEITIYEQRIKRDNELNEIIKSDIEIVKENIKKLEKNK